MVRMHKHAGVLRSSGTYRMHPVSVQHTTYEACNAHDNEVMQEENTSNYVTTKIKVPGCHQHKGIERRNGSFKSHPIKQQHKDVNVQKWHNEELNKYNTIISSSELDANKTKIFRESVVKNDSSTKTVYNILVDNEGYLSLHLDSINAKGLKLTFTRREGNIRKTVALKFENNPATLSPGEKIASDKKLMYEEYN